MKITWKFKFFKIELKFTMGYWLLQLCSSIAFVVMEDAVKCTIHHSVFLLSDIFFKLKLLS